MTSRQISNAVDALIAREEYAIANTIDNRQLSNEDYKVLIEACRNRELMAIVDPRKVHELKQSFRRQG